jgi:hypothetical protein
MVSPWKSFAQPQKDATYLALLTHIPLQRYSLLPRFVSYSFAIQKQLGKTAGVIGYGIRAKPLSNKYWTLSVWADDGALMDFVRTEPHRSSMRAFDGSAVRFTRWTLSGADIPPKWDDAIRRSKEEQHG